MSPGIPTLIVAAASVDVVTAVSLFGIFLGLVFSEGTHLHAPSLIMLPIHTGSRWAAGVSQPSHTPGGLLSLAVCPLAHYVLSDFKLMFSLNVT